VGAGLFLFAVGAVALHFRSETVGEQVGAGLFLFAVGTVDLHFRSETVGEQVGGAIPIRSWGSPLTF
jgi:hypothetical protein